MPHNNLTPKTLVKFKWDHLNWVIDEGRVG